MKARDIHIKIGDALINLKEDQAKYCNDIMSKVSLEPADNEETDKAFDMFHRLVRHELLSTQHSYIKKEFDNSKKGLDEALKKMDIDPDPEPGTTKELYNRDNVKLIKRQNKNSTQIDISQLLIQLARLGVKKSTVDKAVQNATKEKRGNIYYVIELGHDE
jgi:hypothetical protein